MLAVPSFGEPAEQERGTAEEGWQAPIWPGRQQLDARPAKSWLARLDALSSEGKDGTAGGVDGRALPR